MSTGGTERQFFPFLGDGIAQSFGQVPLVAAGVFDLVPGPSIAVRAQLYARAQPRPQLAPSYVGPTPTTPVTVTFPVADLVAPAPRPALARRPLPGRGAGATFLAPSAAIPVVFPITDLVVRAPVPRAPVRPQLRSSAIAPISMPPAYGTAAPLLATLAFERVRLALRYTTDVLMAWNGLESRIALEPVPTELLQGSVLLTNADLARVRAQVFAAPAAPVLLPIRLEDTPVRADVTTNQLAIDATLLDWGVAGDQVLVENVAGQAYVATIQSVAGAGPTTVLTVNVLPPLGQSYLAGVARVAPLRLAYLADGVGVGRYPIAAGQLELAATFAPPRTTYGTGATIATFDGLMVYDRRLNANAMPRETSAANLEVVTASGGAMYTRTSLAKARMRRGARFIVRTPAERQWLRAFLAAARGRQVAFLLPTWTPDVVLAAQPLPAATTLLVASVPDYVGIWWPSLAHRHLQLAFGDGTIGYVTVTAAIDNGDGTQSLTVTSVGAMTSPIIVVSLLERVRFDQDEFVMVAQAGAIAVVDLELLVVQR